ncbi:zinc-binding alcohol dehydrogenase family protein [Paucilactobacillus suebicus]|uniref:Zinc-type alcohol dehydrogenase-like protein n=1 Tax=Paucilactobacillus suebicus DSM 5007 = KCTC 3549 TaxID=1423807 RepID=A0A0R1W1M3_9LACO|nr:zinc-binding alcohol dehydrogenase family protein [Paucilactobacillus suebicus]KRM11768.1 zinc-binding dehydrogenase [Paucilactobacillus suebicus DSM 5007 = KCTC 3549]
MKAIGVYQGTDIKSQEFTTADVAQPVPTNLDVLVKINAVSVNPVDTKVRQTTKQRSLKVLGYDAVGTVEALGEQVTDFTVGDRVFYAGSNQRAGSNQEYQLVDSRIIAKAPTKLVDEDAAAMPLTTLTAAELLFEKFNNPFEKDANEGKTVLIINGAGGVGSSAIQLAKWSGFRVIATASRTETVEWVEKMGADQVINHHHDLIKQLPDDLNQIDDIMILNRTESYFATAAKLVAPLGHVGSIVESSQPLPLGLLKDKAASFDWEFMFTKPKYGVKEASQGQLLTKIAALLDSGDIISTRTKTLSNINANNLKKGHQIVESGKMLGKLVIDGPFTD